MSYLLHLKRYRNIFFSLFPSCCAYLLHLLVPGGMIGAHGAVISTLSTAHCLIHISLSRKARLRSCFIISLGTCIFFNLCILFGAHPLRFWDNVSWSFLMSAILCVPAMNCVGQELESWKRVFLECSFQRVSEKRIYMVSLTTLLGSWVGAFPILLDWNRPWQVWPIPCSMGALIGNLTGYLIANLFISGQDNTEKV